MPTQTRNSTEIIEAPLIERMRLVECIRAEFGDRSVLIGAWADNFYRNRNVGPGEMEFLVERGPIMSRSGIEPVQMRLPGSRISARIVYADEVPQGRIFRIPTSELINTANRSYDMVEGQKRQVAVLGFWQLVVMEYNDIQKAAQPNRRREENIAELINQQFSSSASFLEKNSDNLYRYNKNGWVEGGAKQFTGWMRRLEIPGISRRVEAAPGLS